MSNTVPTLADIAKLLGVRQKSAEVFIALFVHGSMKKGQLVELFEFKEEDVTKALKELNEKHLIGKGLLSYRVRPRAHLEKLTDKQEKGIRIVESFVGEAHSDNPSLGIVKYDGYEGIQQVYLEVLEEAMATGESILAIESGLDAETLDDDFFDKYIKKRIESKVEAYVISPNEEQDRQYKEQNEGPLTHVRLIDKFPIDSNLNIVGGVVMSYRLNPPQGTLRRDRGEANTFKSLFWRLWEGEG